MGVQKEKRMEGDENILRNDEKFFKLDDNYNFPVEESQQTLER